MGLRWEILAGYLPLFGSGLWMTIELTLVAIGAGMVLGMLFGLIDTQLWGTWLIYASAVLTIWSMVYYLQKALPEIRAKAR